MEATIGLYRGYVEVVWDNGKENGAAICCKLFGWRRRYIVELERSSF